MKLVGKVIKGKWNKNYYRVIKLIGSGGVGRVYKVWCDKRKKYLAIKLSEDLHSITKEYNMLEKFQYLKMVPKVLEIDDYIDLGQTKYFIALEYIKGKTLKEYMENYRINIRDLLSIIIIIGEMIKKVHKEGYVFGDVKPENIMIDEKNNEIKVIDLGSLCPIGSSLKEFTPIYDRSKWNVGLRKAEPSYDLFSLCIIISNFILNRGNRILDMKINDIITELRGKQIDSRLLDVLEGGLLQKKIDFDTFIDRLKEIYKYPTMQRKIIRDKRDLIINTFFIGTVVSFITILTLLITV